jgi:hypothetical protein
VVLLFEPLAAVSFRIQPGQHVLQGQAVADASPTH